MRLKTQRRAIYVVMGLTVMSLVGGFAVASFGMGGTNTTQQGSQSTTISAVSGLTFVSTSLGMSSSGFDVCDAATPCDVSAADATVCVGGEGAGSCFGDFVENVTLSTIAHTAFAGTVCVQIYVASGGTPVASNVSEFTNAGGTTAQQINLEFDLGSATSPSQVTSVTTVAQVC